MLIPPTHWNEKHLSTNHYYHQDFRAPQWQSHQPLQKPPITIPRDSLDTSLDTNAGKDISTEYMRTIGQNGSRIIKDQYFGRSTIGKDCKF